MRPSMVIPPACNRHLKAINLIHILHPSSTSYFTPSSWSYNINFSIELRGHEGTFVIYVPLTVFIWKKSQCFDLGFHCREFKYSIGAFHYRECRQGNCRGKGKGKAWLVDLVRETGRTSIPTPVLSVGRVARCKWRSCPNCWKRECWTC
jgi:hypothetical protein